MFNKPKFKKIDRILYRGYEIPIYSDGNSEYIGHPLDADEDVEVNKIYSIDELPQIKNALFHIVKGDSDDDMFPKPIGTIKVSSKTKKSFFESKVVKITEEQLKFLIKTTI